MFSFEIRLVVFCVNFKGTYDVIFVFSATGVEKVAKSSQVLIASHTYIKRMIAIAQRTPRKDMRSSASAFDTKQTRQSFVQQL